MTVVSDLEAMPSYLWFQIIKDHMLSLSYCHIFEFALSQYHVAVDPKEGFCYLDWIDSMEQDILTTPYEVIPIIVACEDEVLSYIQNMIS